MGNQRGFTLLEVAVAGGISLGIILALFGAIQKASEQTVYVDKKIDERVMLTDLRYLLATPTLCMESLDFRFPYVPGKETTVKVNGISVGAGTVLPQYGLRVTSFKTTSVVEFSEKNTFACDGTNVEVKELKKGRLERVSPLPPAQLCTGTLRAYRKISYVDFQFQAESTSSKIVRFRPEQIARVQVTRNWNSETGAEVVTCQAVPGTFDATKVKPLGFDDRVGDPAAGGGAKAASGGAGGRGAMGSPGNPVVAKDLPPVARDNDPNPRFDHKWHIDEEGPPPPPAAREVASTAPPPPPAPEPAPVAPPPEPKRPQRDCAVNVSLEEAMKYHIPTFKSGERTKLPSGECEEKEFTCWDGSLIATGAPVPVPGCTPKPLAAGP